MLIKRAKIGFREKDAEDFLRKFKNLSKDKQEQYVLDVLRSYGVNSIQFLFVVQGLVLWCIKCYWKGTVSQDIVNQIVSTILEKVRVKYDASKGKLLNFLHTEIRGELTKLWYRQCRDLEFLQYEEVRNDGVDSGSLRSEWRFKDEEEDLEKVSKFIRIEELRKKVFLTGDTVYWRKLIWDLYKERLLFWI